VPLEDPAPVLVGHPIGPEHSCEHKGGVGAPEPIATSAVWAEAWAMLKYLDIDLIARYLRKLESLKLA